MFRRRCRWFGTMIRSSDRFHAYRCIRSMGNESFKKVRENFAGDWCERGKASLSSPKNERDLLIRLQLLQRTCPIPIAFGFAMRRFAPHSPGGKGVIIRLALLSSADSAEGC